MPSSTESWGIEVGNHAIKAIHLQKTGGGKAGPRAVLVEHEVIPHKKVLTTPDLDVEEAIRTGLAQFISKRQVGRASVVVSVPGNMAFARFAKLPPVEPKRVPDIVKFEAIQQIPFPIDQVEWDYQVFHQPDSPEVEVGIFAITKDRVMSWLSHFDAAGIDVHGVTLSPIAVYNALAYDLELAADSPGLMLMDVGTLSTDLIVVTEGRIWLRTLPLGGHHFTEAICKGFKLSYSKAEKIKREAATSKYARQIFQAMRPVFVDLVAEVQKSLGYYQSVNREVQINRIIGMGSTFRLPGLQKFIKQQLQIEVTRLDSFKRIEPEGRVAAEFAEHAPELAPAYGLALQGLEMEAVSPNILPAGLIRQQVWRTKSKWNIAAAACIAAAAVIPVMRLTLDKAAYASANEQNNSTIQSAISVAESKVQKLKEVEKEDPRPRIENIRAIHDYREFWPLLMLDVQQALAAATVQPELKAGDPEEIKKIPRRDRREIVLRSIETQYLPDGREASSGGRGGAPMGGFPGMGGSSEGESEASSEAPSRAMLVTLYGVTPFRDAPNYVLDTLWRELTKKIEGERRPYKVVKVESPVFKPAASESEIRQSVYGGPGGRAGTGIGAEGFDPTGGQFGRGLPGVGVRGAVREGQRQLPGVRTPDAQPGNQTPGVPGSPATGAAEPVKDVWSYFPSDPLLEEDIAYDTAFQLRFRLEFYPPEEARKIARMTDAEYEAYRKEQEAKEKGEEGAEGAEDGAGDEADQSPEQEVEEEEAAPAAEEPVTSPPEPSTPEGEQPPAPAGDAPPAGKPAAESPAEPTLEAPTPQEPNP